MFKTTVDQTANVVDNLASLAGLTIPNPDLNQGALVNVADAGSGQSAFYGLFISFATIPPTPDGVNVLDTVLGGDSRWMRMNIATMEIPPQTLVFHAFGRVASDGSAEAGTNFESSQEAAGQYLVRVGALPPGVTGEQLVFLPGLKIGDVGSTLVYDQDISPLNPRDFHIFIRDSTDVALDAPFSFGVLIGTFIPPP